MTTLGQDLIASAREGLAIAAGHAGPGRVFAPPEIDVAARSMLIVIDREPQAVERALRVA